MTLAWPWVWSTSAGARDLELGERPEEARHRHRPRCASNASSPSQSSVPLVPTMRQAAFPAGIGALGAPRAAIGEDHAVVELEDRIGRRAMRVPGARADWSRGNRPPAASLPAMKRAASNVWIAMSSSSTFSISSRKPPKCAPMKKSQCSAVRSPSAPALDQPADAAHAGDEAPVLHHRMDASGRLRPAAIIARPASRLAAIGFSLST